MPHHRNLVLLFTAVLSLNTLNCGTVLAQNDGHYPSFPTLVAQPPAVESPFYNNQVGHRITDANAFQSSSWPHANQPLHPPGPVFDSSSRLVSTYDARRIDFARQTSTQYRSKTYPSSPNVSDLANINATLADQWADLAESTNDVASRVLDAHARLDAVARDFDEVEANIRQFGLTPTIGLLLSHKKSQLVDWQVDGSTNHFVNQEIQRTRVKQLENEMILYDGSDPIRQANEFLALARIDPSNASHAVLASQIQTLLRERHEWLQWLAQAYNDYRQKLGELDSASAAFDKLTADYRKLIHRHVTWIRNTEPLRRTDFSKITPGLHSLFGARRSEDVAFSLSQKWGSNPSSGMTLIATIVLILLVRFLARTWLIGIGTRKRMRESSLQARKCAASVLTPLVAFAIPSVLYLIARWLGTGFVTESTLHVSSAFYAASLVALVVEVPLQLLRRYGFIEKHLHMELPRRQRASAYLRVIGTGLVLGAYVITLAEHIDHGSWTGSVARFGFMAAMLLVAWTAHLALKPKGGFLEPLIEKLGGSVLYRIRYLYYFLGVGFTIAMMTLSVLGYQYTANEIIKRASITFVAVLIAATLWSAVKILASGAWHLLTGTEEERPFYEEDDVQQVRVSGALAEHSLELKHQMAFLSQCALVLAAIVSVGWLWIDIFPNMRLGNPVLWTVQDTVMKTIVDTSGQKVTRSELQATPITLVHLALAGAALFVAFQLAKLLPSIFDALVLQRVSFDEAMEHLTLVLGRFFLFGAGCFIACRLIGLRWETMQWLAVGLAVGVGFALQDILRNLFGGIVVLFEKPARLGDLITVGNITGRVAAQKLRTTVLSDEDGREVIIPNRNFVSHDVVNWMGAGRLKVIPIEVSVTREERPADVCRMLQQLLTDQPELLLSPAPQATLVCVSQKSQRIELRAWVEEHIDATRYRDSLTTIVRNFLAENNLLTANQPSQPSLKESITSDSLDGSRPRTKRSA